jgi:hypothetical protein
LGALAVSFLAYAGLSVIYNATIWKGLVQPDMFWVFFKVFDNPAMPLCILLLIVAALLPDLALQVVETSRVRATFLRQMFSCPPVQVHSISFFSFFLFLKWQIRETSMVI